MTATNKLDLFFFNGTDGHHDENFKEHAYFMMTVPNFTLGGLNIPMQHPQPRTAPVDTALAQHTVTATAADTDDGTADNGTAEADTGETVKRTRRRAEDTVHLGYE